MWWRALVQLPLAPQKPREHNWVRVSSNQIPLPIRDPFGEGFGKLQCSCTLTGPEITNILLLYWLWFAPSVRFRTRWLLMLVVMWGPLVTGAVVCVISPSRFLCVRLVLMPGVVLFLVGVRVSNVPLLQLIIFRPVADRFGQDWFRF